MEKLTINTFFSGIGCQERGFKDSGLFDIEVLSTSEISKYSILSYAAIHCGLTNEMAENYTEYPSIAEMVADLTKKDIGYEPEKDKHFNWSKVSEKELKKYWLACKLSNGVGNISNIKSLPKADLWFCSFPCTDISQSGRMKGLKEDSGTRSSLLWENIRLLKYAVDNNEAPKYIMIENVKNLVTKFKNDFLNLIDILSELGYNSYWDILDGKTCGIPQSRPRAFVVSIRKDIDSGSFVFPSPFTCDTVIKDYLVDLSDVDKKYYVSTLVQNRFELLDDTFTKNIIGTTKPDYRSVGQRDRVYNQLGICAALMSTDYKQPKQILDKPYTVDTYDENTVRVRKLMPKECARLMGFTFEDCEKAQAIGISDNKLYEQFGNGIITNCVRLIAEHLYKAQYDISYICEDEVI